MANLIPQPFAARMGQGVTQHAISLDVKDERDGGERAFNGILTMSLLIFFNDGIRYFTQRTGVFRLKVS